MSTARGLARVAGLIGGVGCAEAPTPKGATAWADYTVDVPPLQEGHAQIRTPVLEVPAYTEGRVCVFDTWEGPESGIIRALDLFHPDITHHIAVLDVTDDVFPDDELIYCSSTDPGGMVPYGLLFDGAGPEAPGEEFDAPGPDWEVSWFDKEVARVSMLVLPEGVAFRLMPQQRLAIDFHFVNTSELPARTNAAFDLELLPAEEVEAWAGVAMLDSAPFDLPPGRSSFEFDCPVPHEIEVIDVQGHMHELGARFDFEVVRADGTIEPVYAVDPWTPGLRTDPPSQAYGPGEMVLRPGDLMRTRCTWENPSEQHLPYPAEMCTTTFVGFPLERSYVCFNGRVVE